MPYDVYSPAIAMVESSSLSVDSNEQENAQASCNEQQCSLLLFRVESWLLRDQELSLNTL